MKTVKCDICGKTIKGGDGMPSFRDTFDSIHIQIAFGPDYKTPAGYDVCSKCKDRMWKYLKHEADQEGTQND